jgi:hypothetical protein
VKLTNTDNDSPGIMVNALDTLSHENGATARVSYVLSSEPTADVVLTLESSDPGEGAAAPATLTFTPENWAAPQDVFVTGQDDALEDGNQVTSCACSLCRATTRTTTWSGCAGEPEQRRQRHGGH